MASPAREWSLWPRLSCILALQSLYRISLSNLSSSDNVTRSDFTRYLKTAIESYEFVLFHISVKSRLSPYL
jgi:hypothetical protein